MADKSLGDHFVDAAIKHPGALHRDLGIPENETIPHDMLVRAAKRKDKTGERARFALVLEKMHHRGA